jgi:biopolymer transport protein ExbD
MTEISVTGNIGNGRRRAGVRRMKRHSVKTDMTPMVDLGFLLIAFFVMTTELIKPTVVNLNMPKSGPPMPVGNSNALTILLDDNDRVYYYPGDWKEALANGQVFKTNFSETGGLGKVIREKQKWLEANSKKEGRDGLMLLIKPGKGANYRNVINTLDEALINVVKKYALLPVEPEETEWMKKQNQ